jgi:hypothetical protein
MRLIRTGEKKPYDQLPICITASEHDYLDKEPYLLDNPIIQRYMRIVEETLRISVPFNPVFMAHSLSMRAVALGLYVNDIDNDYKLSDMALDLAPASWLNRVIPGIDSKQHLKYLPKLDKVLFSKGIAHSYALAMALLCESVDEAVRLLCGSCDLGVTMPPVDRT